ncbi:hypothetical protein F8568_026980 [Actinomadura sp. LD22]|uniref:DUF2273 domain-containing protein n=1 Tax=Actinomadura physcomitrii TaxID=2650748 RepID=A0A6I4MIH3_9ACTN|nr:hypothetical protein [Actinomadura physcomitrii]MWA03964.1 hypothetical protein [Actinomadura physcomitrii]
MIPVWPLAGLAFGVALGFAGAFGGFGPFFIVLFLGCLGFLTGRAIEGNLDIRQLFSINTGRRPR